MILSQRGLVEPGIKIFAAEFVNISVAVNLDVSFVCTTLTPLNISNRPCCLIGMVNFWSSMLIRMLAVR